MYWIDSLNVLLSTELKYERVTNMLHKTH